MASSASSVTETAKQEAAQLADIREWHARASAPDVVDAPVGVEDIDQLILDVGLLLARLDEATAACRTALPWMGKALADEAFADTDRPGLAESARDALFAGVMKMEGR